MNRPIKFRCWDGKKMYYPKMGQSIRLITDIVDHARLVDENGVGICEVQDLQQYTGIDGNIYEGDIVRAKVRKKAGEVLKVEGEVFYDEMEHMFCVVVADGEKTYSCNRLHAYEVIGNIYEQS